MDASAKDKRVKEHFTKKQNMLKSNFIMLLNWDKTAFVRNLQETNAFVCFRVASTELGNLMYL